MNVVSLAPAPVEPGTRYHRVRDALRADIVAGALLPGEHLKMAALVKRYGTSPAPIREALGQLEGEGWIEILPNRGARVRGIERTFIAELFEIRIALEPLLAGYSAAVAQPDDVARLRDIHATYTEAVRAAGTAAIMHANTAFHLAILSIRPNREAMVLLEQHSAFVSAARRAFGYATARLPSMLTEHEELIAAFDRRDADAARDVMRLHIQHSIDELIPRLSGPA